MNRRPLTPEQAGQITEAALKLSLASFSDGQRCNSFLYDKSEQQQARAEAEAARVAFLTAITELVSY